ncbi:MAG: hypothetical protein JWQ73_526 [Variovorax sp.]|nr:hypothetical protein [Variovorax sp.]
MAKSGKNSRSGNETGFADLGKADGSKEPARRLSWLWIAPAVVAVLVVLAVVVLR